MIAIWSLRHVIAYVWPPEQPIRQALIPGREIILPYDLHCLHRQFQMGGGAAVGVRWV